MKKTIFCVVLLMTFLLTSCQSLWMKKKPWSTRTVQSLIRSNPEPNGINFDKELRWNYASGLVFSAMLEEWKRTKDPAVLAYVDRYYDELIEEDGTIRTYSAEKCNIDICDKDMKSLLLCDSSFLFDDYDMWYHLVQNLQK